MDTFNIKSSDGTMLAAYRWPATLPARGTVIVVHGLSEHARRYAAFAQAMNTAGLHVVAFDQRGHGMTTPAIDHGHLDARVRWPQLLDDVRIVRDQLVSDQPDEAGQPAILFGHSLGSFIAQGVLQTGGGKGWAAAVLSGTARPGRLSCYLGAWLAMAERWRVGAAGRSRLLHRLTFGAYARSNRHKHDDTPDDFAWLSNDPAATAAYANDPDTGFTPSVTAWRCLLNGMARVQSPQHMRRVDAALPMLIAAGTDDPFGDWGRQPRAQARAWRNNGQHDVTTWLYDGARHELLHDHAAPAFIADMLGWLEQRGI